MENPSVLGSEVSTSNVFEINGAQNFNVIDQQVNYYHLEPQVAGTCFPSADSSNDKKVSFKSDKSPISSDDAYECSICVSDLDDDVEDTESLQGNGLTKQEKIKGPERKTPFLLKTIFGRGLKTEKEKQNSNHETGFVKNHPTAFRPLREESEHGRNYYSLYVEQSSELEKATHDILFLRGNLLKVTEENKLLNTKLKKLQQRNAILVSENTSSLETKTQRTKNHRAQTLNTVLTMTKDVRERIIQAFPSDFIRMFTFENIEKVVDLMKCRMTKEGFRLFSEGNPGNILFIVETGCYEFKKRQESVCDVTTSVSKPNATKWDLLAWEEFFFNSMHVSTCICKEPGKVWWIRRSEFQNTIGNIAPVRLLAIYDCLSQVFPSFSQKQRLHLTKKCEVLLLSAGDFLVRSGDTVRHIFVVKKGQLITLSHGKSRGKLLSVGDVISQPCDLIRFTHSYVAYGIQTVQCIAIPVTKFSSSQLRKITSSDLDATRENVLRNFEVHLNDAENPDEDKSGTSGYVSQSSTSTQSTKM